VGTQGKATQTLSLSMAADSKPVWQWDAKKNSWQKYEGSVPQKMTSGVQLSAVNVIVLKLNEVTAGGLDPAGNPIPTYKTTGTGTGLIAIAGKTLPIKWSKAKATDVFTLTDEKGNPIALMPGNTFVELMPASTGTIKIK
jgi:hypothetical protein